MLPFRRACKELHKMSGNVEAGSGPMNVVKWLVAIAVLATAIGGNYMYADQFPFIYRVLAVVALVLVALGVAATTVQGQTFRVMLKDANIERRKVVWPTRQETFQTTMIVVIAVIIVGFILWAIDSLLSWIIKLLIG